MSICTLESAQRVEAAVEAPALLPVRPQTEKALAPPAARGDFFLDVLERGLVAGFFVWLVVRLMLNYYSDGNWGSLLVIPSEGLVVFFILIRRTSQAMSHRPWEWMMAMTASCAPMLVMPTSDANLIPVAVGGALMLAGLVLQIYAKVRLGRSFGCVPAHRGLQLCGPYRIVRHPIYAGYMLGHLAYLALNPSLWNLAVYGVCYVLQIPRLLAEERLLSVDPDYRDYQSQVRYRLIPGVF